MSFTNPADKSINQSNNQSVNQSENKLLTNQSINQSINQSENDQPINQPINQSINQSENPITKRLINQSIEWSNSRSLWERTKTTDTKIPSANVILDRKSSICRRNSSSGRFSRTLTTGRLINRITPRVGVHWLMHRQHSTSHSQWDRPSKGVIRWLWQGGVVRIIAVKKRWPLLRRWRLQAQSRTTTGHTGGTRESRRSGLNRAVEGVWIFWRKGTTRSAGVERRGRQRHPGDRRALIRAWKKEKKICLLFFKKIFFF